MIARGTMDLNLLKAEIIDDPEDIEIAEDAMSRHHYLGSKKLEGERMRVCDHDEGRVGGAAVLRARDPA